MSPSDSGFDIQQLSSLEKLDLIGQLWDSLPDSPPMLPMPEWHRQELERRLDNADAAPDTASSWEEVQLRLGRKL
jgi:putative addiction module component (TIGR02574 family)